MLRVSRMILSESSPGGFGFVPLRVARRDHVPLCRSRETMVRLPRRAETGAAGLAAYTKTQLVRVRSMVRTLAEPKS